jgi:hypothetical protein
MNESFDVEYVTVNRFDKVAFTRFHNLPKAIVDKRHASYQIRFVQKCDASAKPERPPPTPEAE